MDTRLEQLIDEILDTVAEDYKEYDFTLGVGTYMCQKDKVAKILRDYLHDELQYDVDGNYFFDKGD